MEKEISDCIHLLLKQVQKNQYVVLFDAIDKQKEYNENNLIKNMKNYITANDFPAVKKYLYTLLLKNLNNHQNESSIDNQLREKLSFTEILYKKGLYRQGRNIIKNAEKVALEHEKYSLLIEFCKYKDYLIIELEGYIDTVKGKKSLMKWKRYALIILPILTLTIT